MAHTLTLHQIISSLRAQLPKIDDIGFGVMLANDSLSIIWDAADWLPSIGELTPFYIVPQLQDYGAPQNIIPSDILYIREAWIRDMDGMSFKPMTCTRQLPRMQTLGALPEMISFRPELNAFRVSPTPSPAVAAPRFQVEGSYKKQHTLVTQSNYTNVALPWDDQYAYVFKSMLKWKYYEALGDPRAGQISFTDAGIQATGAAGEALDSLSRMLQREGLTQNEIFAPAENFIGRGYWWP